MEDKDKKQYWDGNKNRLIRFYFYSQRGLALFNEARYLIMAIFATYFALKLANPIWFVLMFVVSVPILIFAGWFAVHHVGKVVDYLNIQFSTHFSRYQFTLLEQIRNQLRRLNGEDIDENGNPKSS